MKVLLKSTVQGVGRAGEVRVVPDGYARNFLIPRKLGVPATAEAIQRTVQEAASRQHHEEAAAAGLIEAAQRLDGSSFVITAKASKQGRLFGSVGLNQIIEALKASSGITVPDSALQLDRPIDSLGEHKLTLKLGQRIATVTATIISQT